MDCSHVSKRSPIPEFQPQRNMNTRLMPHLQLMRKFMSSPRGAIALLLIAGVAWGIALRSRVSPSARHLEAGIEFAHKSHLTAAQSEWRLAASLAPDDPQAWEYLAESYLDIHNWTQSLEALNQLERLRPDSPHLHAPVNSPPPGCDRNVRAQPQVTSLRISKRKPPVPIHGLR